MSEAWRVQERELCTATSSTVWNARNCLADAIRLVQTPKQAMNTKRILLILSITAAACAALFVAAYLHLASNAWSLSTRQAANEAHSAFRLRLQQQASFQSGLCPDSRHCVYLEMGHLPLDGRLKEEITSELGPHCAPTGAAQDLCAWWRKNRLNSVQLVFVGGQSPACREHWLFNYSTNSVTRKETC